MPYAIHTTETFKKLYQTLDGNEKQWITKIKAKLEANVTGKILRFDWFREKKYLNKRLYFLVDFKAEKMLFVAFASKKDQQHVIDFVTENKEELLAYLKKL